MMKLHLALALGAATISVPLLAQAPGGGMQRDQTRQEAQQRADMMFQMMDANRDGTVTRTEAEQAAAQFAARSGGDEGRGGGRIQCMIDQAFGTAQSLTQAQFEAQALARFDAMDLNHDGVVTAAERQQARQMRGQAQPQPAPQPPGQ
jgi:Ca2+-binding EF-hand superfamily protein